MAIIKKKGNNKCWWGCGEKGAIVHCWWKCKLVQSLWKTVWRFLRKLNIELPYDPAIPFLSIYLKKAKTLTWKDICTSMSIAALFTMVSTWKQPKCSSVNEWIKKLWYVCTMEYYSVIEKNENFAICNNMDGLGGCYAKWSKSDRERQILHDITYMWNLKNTTS